MTVLARVAMTIVAVFMAPLIVIVSGLYGLWMVIHYEIWDGE